MMKNIVKILAVIILVGGTLTVNAQQKGTKLGHLNFSELVQKMPGNDTLNTSLQSFIKQIQDQYSSMQTELQGKYKEFADKQKEMSDIIKATKQKEIQDLDQRMQEFNQNADQEISNKRTALLAPFIDKAKKAIADVAKDNGYAYIFDEASLLYAGGGEDVTAMVKKKLNMN
jgi:outer membrane protein